MSQSNMKKLGFGLMRLPNTGGKIDRAQVRDMVDLFLKRGFTYFDTAYIYGDGESERTFRETVVERYPRNAYTITDKIDAVPVQYKLRIAAWNGIIFNVVGVWAVAGFKRPLEQMAAELTEITAHLYDAEAAAVFDPHL